MIDARPGDAAGRNVPAGAPTTPRSRILGNTLWLLGSELAGRALSFLAILHLTRALDRSTQGALELGLAIFAFVQLVSLGGVEVLAMRRAARSARALPALVGITMAVGWVGFAFAFALALVIVSLAQLDAPAPWLILGFAAAAAAVPSGPRFVFVARERVRVLALAAVAPAALWLLGVRVLIVDAEDAHLAPLVWIGAEGLRALIPLWAFTRRWGAPRLRVGWRRLRAWARASVGVAIGRVARGVAYLADLVVLGAFAPLEIVGLYAVGLRLPMFMVLAWEMGQRSLFASAARLAGAGDRAATGQFQTRALKIALGLTLPAVLTLSIVAAPFLTLVFGPRWAASATIFQILLWRVPLAAVGGLYRQLVWAADPRLELRLGLTSAAILAICLLALAPTLGATGCAIGVVAAETLAVALYARASHPWVALRWAGHGRWIAGMAAGVVAIAILGVLAPALPPVVAIGAAVITGGLAAVAGVSSEWRR